MSGSMRDSEPNSPVSPMSPQSPGSPAEPVKLPHKGGSFHTLQTTISKAVQSLVSSPAGKSALSRQPRSANVHTCSHTGDFMFFNYKMQHHRFLR